MTILDDSFGVLVLRLGVNGMHLYCCRWAMENRQSNHRFVVEPAELGAAVMGLAFSAGTAQLVREASPVEDLAGPSTDAVTMDDCPSDESAAGDDGNEVVVKEGGEAAGKAAAAAQGREEAAAATNAGGSPGIVSVHASEASLNDSSASDEMPSGSGSGRVREAVRSLEAGVTSETIDVRYGPGDMSRSRPQGRSDGERR